MARRRPFGVVAVAALGLTACSSTTHPRVLDVHGDPTSTVLTMSVESCNQHPEVEADETSTEVRLTVTADADTVEDCADGAKVSLEAPLGDRVVIDEASGESVEVLPSTSG
jgi:hypothetical protein